MKKITSKEFKEIIAKSGISYDGDFGTVLNTLSILYNRSADLFKIENITNVSRDNDKIIKIYQDRSHKIYECLDELGYYDDVKEK